MASLTHCRVGDAAHHRRVAGLVFRSTEAGADEVQVGRFEQPQTARRGADGCPRPCAVIRGTHGVSDQARADRDLVRHDDRIQQVLTRPREIFGDSQRRWHDARAGMPLRRMDAVVDVDVDGVGAVGVGQCGSDRRKHPLQTKHGALPLPVLRSGKPRHHFGRWGECPRDGRG
jgi:hypothetical protein